MPTAEIADEYFELFESLGGHTDLRVWTAYEGPKIQQQKEDIYFGADVVIATPKRLNELLNIEGFNSASVQTLVLDEADQLLKVGAISFTQRISDSIPPKQRVALSSSEKSVAAYMNRFALPFYEGEVKRVAIEYSRSSGQYPICLAGCTAAVRRNSISHQRLASEIRASPSFICNGS